MLAGRVLLTGTGGRGFVDVIVFCVEGGDVTGDTVPLFLDRSVVEFSVLTCSAIIVADYAPE